MLVVGLRVHPGGSLLGIVVLPIHGMVGHHLGCVKLSRPATGVRVVECSQCCWMKKVVVRREGPRGFCFVGSSRMAGAGSEGLEHMTERKKD